MGASECFQSEASTGPITRSFNGYVGQNYSSFLYIFLSQLSCSSLLVLLGRTVYVLQDQSFASALNKLDQILRANYVRREQMESRFFIKGHVRRHKLNAIRWRRRFAQMVGPRNRVPECQCLSRLTNWFYPGAGKSADCSGYPQARHVASLFLSVPPYSARELHS